MQSYIEELKKEIYELKVRVTKLEEEFQHRNNNKEQCKSNNKKYSDCDENKSNIYVRNLKIPERDRFGRVCSVNEEIKKALDNQIIDYYEYKLILRLSVEDEEFVPVEYLMELERLTLEPIMDMVIKLENLGYVEVMNK